MSLVNPKIFTKSLKLMGNQFQFSIVDEDEDHAYTLIDKAIDEVKRIEKLFTTYDEKSQTNQINENAGIKPVVVDEEVFRLIERSIRISDLTRGAFDITYGSIDKSLWNFDKTMTKLPDKETAKKMVRLINYKNIVLDKSQHSVFLKGKGMRIGFGGIGKGYAAERAKEVLKKLEVKSGIVNAAGDVTVWGSQPDGQPWTIGIANPDLKTHPFATLQLGNGAIATSGNYEKYVIIDGKKYSHTIDPKTGLPVEGIKSVTVMCENAELADALATPVIVMGVDAALHLLNQMKGIACIIIDDFNNIYHTKNIRFSYA